MSLGAFWIAYSLWLGVAVALWLFYKISNKNIDYIPNGPPQQTLSGALLWPVYLVLFACFWILRATGLK